jgi:FdhD protein
MSHSSTSTYIIKKVSASGALDAEDNLATEEPLEIRLVYGEAKLRQTKNISVTMRTPGHDRELAIGFLFTEGIISGSIQIKGFPDAKGPLKDNIVEVELKEDVVFDTGKLERHFYTSSSCGVCGKASIEAVRTVAESEDYPFDGITLPFQSFYQLPELLNNRQEVFRSTGGLHASALFDLDNNLLAIREDVGRHNALDKLIGAALLEGKVPLDSHILLLSGRASFELIQKAAAAGIKIVAAVGAPSSLAVQLANEFNITLIGFLRNERYNIYSGMHRVIL